jgi:DNA polymerase I-like protein with 3'-5' exonuclease and polymerase domains
MQMSINNVNDKINLNVPLGTDVQFGKTYADIH